MLKRHLPAHPGCLFLLHASNMNRVGGSSLNPNEGSADHDDGAEHRRV